MFDKWATGCPDKYLHSSNDVVETKGETIRWRKRAYGNFFIIDLKERDLSLAKKRMFCTNVLGKSLFFLNNIFCHKTNQTIRWRIKRNSINTDLSSLYIKDLMT